MPEAMKQLEVRILDRAFKVQVPPSEAERLQEAARLVDAKMREIQGAGRGSMGLDRIAVNAALQLAYEFLGQGATVRPDGTQYVAAVRSLIDQVDMALDRASRSSAAP